MSEFIRCQRCGGEPVRGEFDNWSMERKDLVKCRGCGDYESPVAWNAEQIAARADKEFQLVVAMSVSSYNDARGIPFWFEYDAIIGRARSILDALYGEIKGGE